MNSKNFSHPLFGEITIIYDGRGNVYSIGDQLAEKLGCSIKENVPEEFIIFLKEIKRYDIEKFLPEEYKKSDTIILKEAGTHILLASSTNPIAKDLCIWLFSEVFPRIRGNPYHAAFY